ncbi:MAG: hypothetical protein ACX93T_04340 [Bacteroidota bacterium]
MHIKTKYYCLILISLTFYSPVEAGVSSWFRDVRRAILNKVPVVGDAAAKARLENKVDHIKDKQRSGLDKLRDIAQKAQKTKRQVEEMYYFKKESQRRAEDLVQGLRRGKTRNLLGALVECWINIPINPADYIPETPYTRALKSNLEWDLSSERGLVQQYGYFLQGTRAALSEQPNALDQQPEQFNKAYEGALQYEQTLKKALAAKKQAAIKLYKEDITNLEKEITVLEDTKKKKGLTIGDVMQIEIAIDNKRHIIRILNEKVTHGLQEEMQLTDEQKETLGIQKAKKDTEELVDLLEKDRVRIHQKYSHLWRFW